MLEDQVSKDWQFQFLESFDFRDPLSLGLSLPPKMGHGHDMSKTRLSQNLESESCTSQQVDKDE